MSYRAGYSTLELSAGTVVASTTLSGAAVNTDTLAASSSEIGNAELANNAASGLKVSPEYGTIKAGSPAAGGRCLYAGTSTTNAGSQAWVLFPATAFAAAPTAIIPVNTLAMANEGNTFFIPTGSISAGSFWVTSSVASTTFMYIAVGSGRQ